ncbi:PREDICTED: uncharacterized protein LOC105951131 [Erythranthe guttata]|uniref:uncharacterized protein LOC105951131 n=1 Tax=Erythranthe guttata TaxID=4155 RepID=UPI00064E09E3|nr:PREDICTED: uncharacterized protein LOC105951131 [Erythranthe guttata]|eukprot:XP_012829974.1 PREDICTED: uncharacterized protein LOC105951131 [Erythranthe guttata]
MTNIDLVNERYEDNLYFDPAVLERNEYEDFSHFVDIVFDSREELINDGKHTHPPTLFPHGHGTTSRITPQQKARIKELRNSHVKPMLIMDRLRKDDPTIQTSMKHVYNELANIKSEEIEGMTVIQFLMHNFQQGEYRYWHRVDSETNNTITDVMFACPESIKLLRLFLYVILMDCTYKTNKYGMSLLEIIGITPVGRNFTIAFAFMSHEDADTYEWTRGEILRQIRIYGRQQRPMSNIPTLIQYLNDTRLIYKEKFVRAYSRNVYHFSNTSTNRVESAHSSAKGWLNASTGGLDNVQGKLRDQVYIQISQQKWEFSLSPKIRKHNIA